MIKNHNRMQKIVGVSIAVIQVFDIIIHAATAQLEFLRVISNLVVLIWLTVLFFGKLEIKPIASFATVGLYLLLNLLFLTQAGFTNPAQGNAPRTMLILLVILTTLLGAWLAARRPNH